MPKLVWRVKRVAELQAGVMTETEVAHIERGEEAGLADLGLRLDEAKQLTAALQAEMVSAQVTAKFAALAPFGKVAALLSELLPISGAQNAGTVRNRTLRVGQEVVPQRPIDPAQPPAAPAAGPVVVGPDGGYVRSRHRPERHFEVIAGKVIDARGAQHRFAFARNGQATASEA